MIRVFGAADRDFRSNGEIVVKPFAARVTKEDNGEFYLELEAGVEYSRWLTANNIIVANTPSGDQPFRIGSPQKTRDRIIVHADHVFYDSANLVIQDSRPTGKTCAQALAVLNAAAEPSTPFTTGGHTDGTNTYYCIRTSLHDAVIEVLNRWGGHLVRDGFNIRIDETIGSDNGVVVRYGKNLREIECVEDWSNVVTKLMPVGNDGVMLPEVWLTADVQYDIPYAKCITFSQNIDSEDYKGDDGEIDEEAYHAALREDLRNVATAYLNANKHPLVSYTLSADVDRVYDVGDVIEVVDERLGIDLLTNVTRYEYDCILGRFESIEFGTIMPGLGGLLDDISASTSSQITASTDTMKSQIDAAVNAEAARVNGILSGGDVTFNGSEIVVNGANNRSMKLDKNGVSFGQSGAYVGAWTLQNVLSVEALTVNGQPYSPGSLSVASGYTSSSYTGVQNVWVSLPISGGASSGNLSVSNNGITVGAGVSYVLLFARVDFGESFTSGSRKVRAQKNGSTVAEVTAYAYVGDTFSADVVGVLVPVAENDVLTLSAYVIDPADEIQSGAMLTGVAV